MFSYRHAFHAGNHADVLKHAILVHTLDYFNRKDAPYWVIDTHAGAGLYSLDSDWAAKTSEFADGIGRLWERDDLPPLLADYMARIRAFNTNGRLKRYPGSPWLTLDALRPSDRLRLFEMHPTEIDTLVGNLEHGPHRAAPDHHLRRRRLRGRQGPAAAAHAPRHGADRPVL